MRVAGIPHTNKNAWWILTPQPSSSFVRLGKELQVVSHARLPKLILKFASAGFAVFSVWFPWEHLNEWFVCMWWAQLKLPLNGFFHWWSYTGRNIPQYSYAKDSLYSVREASKSVEKRLVLYLLKDWEEIVFSAVILNFIQWKVAFLEGLEGRSWRGMLDLGFRVIMWTHCWKVNIFSTFFFDIGALWISCALCL